MTPQGDSRGKIIVALAVIVLVLAGALVLVLAAPHSITTALGAQSDCGFTTICAAMSAPGIQLVLTIDSDILRPNDSFTLNVAEFNTLSVTNNVTTASQWKLSELSGWGCGPDSGWLPNGVALFKGYYTLSNLSSASPIQFLPTGYCPPDYIFNATGGITGELINMTSYAFQPESDNASFAGYYCPSSSSSLCVSPESPAFGAFYPQVMSGYASISATNCVSPNENPCFGDISTATSTYTLVVGDEWGALVLLHFSVI
jgi:hypothetical protein